jgi:ATP-dependent DNA helicase DinG
VLCTSYAQVESISEHIAADRLVSQREGERFSEAQKRFEALYRQGKKPVFVGVGAAWTGVDFADAQAKDGRDDFMLTDLIIACLPVGLNRSETMLARVERTGTWAIEKEAVIMLKQGLGRLIRRSGLTDRHIWFLDGRLWLPWPGMESFTAAARRVLMEYHHIAKV